MIKSNKAIVFLLLFLLILIYGCNRQKTPAKSLEEIRTGTEGIVISFLPNAPSLIIHAEQSSDNSFDVVLEVRNKGAYPQPDDGLTAPFGDIYLSGYDRSILDFTPQAFNLNDRALEGKSNINLNGGLDLATFKGTVKIENLNVEKYEPTLLATACYTYTTIAGPQVCIDPNPYSTSKEKKVCQVADITLSNQGAPVAVVKIEEEALSTKMQFKITIKNVGNGEVIKPDSLSKCSPYSSDRLLREEIDRVQLEEVRVSNINLNCRPFVDSGADAIAQGVSGFIRLINGEGFIICELPKSEYGQANTAYTTPLRIKLNYVYRNSVERKLQIKRETSGIGGDTLTSPYNTENEPVYI